MVRRDSVLLFVYLIDEPGGFYLLNDGIVKELLRLHEFGFRALRHIEHGLDFRRGHQWSHRKDVLVLIVSRFETSRSAVLRNLPMDLIVASLSRRIIAMASM